MGTTREGLFVGMNDTYSTYLQSAAWQAKRQQRLALSGHVCEACGTKDSLQIHHLTYERIFREEMEDLMTLCRIHHEAAEEMIQKGAIPRKGDPSKLHQVTLEFIKPRLKFTPRFKTPRVKDTRPAKKKAARSTKARRKSSEEIRGELMDDPEFVKALELTKKLFKSFLNKRFHNSGKMRNRIFSNAHMLFQRRQLEIKLTGRRDHFLPVWKPIPKPGRDMGIPTGISGEYFRNQNT